MSVQSLNSPQTPNFHQVIRLEILREIGAWTKIDRRGQTLRNLYRLIRNAKIGQNQLRGENTDIPF